MDDSKKQFIGLVTESLMEYRQTLYENLKEQLEDLMEEGEGDCVVAWNTALTEAIDKAHFVLIYEKS